MTTNGPEGLQRRNVIGLGLLERWKSRPLPTEEEIAAQALKLEHRRLKRRTLGKGALVAGIFYKLPWLEALTGAFRSKIDFLEGQEDRLHQGQTDSLALVFPGAQVRVGRRHAEPIASELSYLGAVAYVSYAGNDPDVKGIADRVEKYQKKHKNLRSISLYGVSLGAQISGGVMEELDKRGSKLKLKSVELDSVPPNFSYTDFPWAEGLVDPLYVVGGDPLLTAAGNYKVFGNVFEPGTTPSRLLIAQMRFLKHGDHYLDVLGRIAGRDNARVGFLTPENPEADGTTDPVRSEARLREIFPGMNTFKVTGNGEPDNWQGHANPDQNGIGYRAALREMLKKWEIVG